MTLANGRKHQEVVDYLKGAVKRKNSLVPKIDLLWVQMYKFCRAHVKASLHIENH